MPPPPPESPSWPKSRLRDPQPVRSRGPPPESAPGPNQPSTVCATPWHRDVSPKKPQASPHATDAYQSVAATTAPSRVRPRMSTPAPFFSSVAMPPPMTPMTMNDPSRQHRPTS